MSTVIEDIIARKVFNSRGEETIEVDVITASGFGRASAPAGESRGKAEVVYYPKGGVDEAVKKVEELIAPELVGLNADFQEEIDKTLHEIDNTKDFRIIGGNTAFTISLANAEATANSYGLPLFQYLGGYAAHELPYPLGNVISGGRHTSGKSPDIQEFLVLPYGAESFLEAAAANVKIHKKVWEILKKKDKLFNNGRSDEGAWTANITNLEALEILADACEKVSNEVNFNCSPGVDVAASTLWNHKSKRYVYQRDGKGRDSGEQLEFILQLVEKYHLAYVEDPFHEEDYESFAELTKKAKNCLICGDDLFATNHERLAHGVEIHAANAIIIKVNQVGTLTDALETIEAAKRAGYVPVISHRSGDTCDWHIAHLAVAFKCPIIKTGVVEGARIAKINELIRVEEFLGDRAKMAEIQIL
ncbi:MAG: enolase C-terminal domain-like protein [Candidatus Bathyarchaeota archaeon]|jgi:enolase|nr:phosphopyruvate hydratase [Candidatus Bathyarchaeota archaeon A05DMB-3]MDH7607181.1 enolase C-terminal domain-like protein [Candidatus Bathyarchaeota archaeon]